MNTVMCMRFQNEYFVETKALLSVDDIHVGYICADIYFVKDQQKFFLKNYVNLFFLYFGQFS